MIDPNRYGELLDMWKDGFREEVVDAWLKEDDCKWWAVCFGVQLCQDFDAVDGAEFAQLMMERGGNEPMYFATARSIFVQCRNDNRLRLRHNREGQIPD